jgi:hypothetical protein
MDEARGAEVGNKWDIFGTFLSTKALIINKLIQNHFFQKMGNFGACKDPMHCVSTQHGFSNVFLPFSHRVSPFRGLGFIFDTL